ncbi:MAG: flagellar motor protein MotB [Elusimicrobia bacterium]|nr:flagellar motor protein MotB [Elusimicrobiota bacterium]
MSILKPPRGYISETDARVSQVGHAAPPWLINYADLMTELAAFFIMMYAMASALSGTMQKATKEVKETMKQEGIAGEAKMTKEGLKITFEEQQSVPFFVSGSAELLPAMKQYINKITPVLKKGLALKNNVLIVEGHTDNVPIATTQFASNWELSTARATNVVKYIISQGISPEKMAAIGYGEHKPIVPNDSDANKAKNRRVVFLIKLVSPEGEAK